ncbi:MAG: hypothetical protein HC831_30075 [Chloroflexia bacterium]|nr:hypothetical protein [Chloroflexia bacterium]
MLLTEKSVRAQGELIGTNLLEYQLGNIPSLRPEYQSSLYDQLNLSYKYKLFSLQTRIEQYYPSFGDELGYKTISQYRAQYKNKDLAIAVGNIHTTFGKGLLLRTYEISGSIWEDRGYRIRYGFYKDIEGAEIKYQLGRFKLKGIYGNVLDVALPPTIENKERRPDLIQGGELSYQNKKRTIGAIYMNHKNAATNNHYTAAYVKTTLFKDFSVYGEFALQSGSGANLAFNNDSAYAAYFSLNYTKNRLGVSAEIKDYKNFSIGAGITDPPTLVKEHSYKLLNRSTHIPILTYERGYQLEIYYRFSNGSLITLNNSLSENKLSDDNSPVFKEFFAEYQFNIGANVFSHAFVDYSSDPFTNENNRYASGFILDIGHNKMNSTVEVQLQFIEREVIEASNFSNMYFSYTLAIDSKISASALLEISNDPFLLNTDEKNVLYPGISFSYKPNYKNSIQLFYGKRRGGPACNSGVCYDVLDFQGLELRILSQF